MAFYDLVDKVVELLQRRGRLSYRALKLEFDLTDARIDDLKYELVEVQRVARDENGVLLVWTPTPTTPPDDHHVASPPAVAAPPLAPDRPGRPAGADAERRQLTVLFCDLVGSTALSTELDPEELREVLDEYQTVCARVIEHFGGVIARQVGDGLLVNFGYPQAYEDDAGRGVRAGLAIIGALPELNARLAPRFVHLRQRRLQLRIGLHTGLVVVGALGASTYRDPMAVVGETPNIAARLQGLAEPDEVVVSGTTRRLLGDAFECDDLGLHELKGVTAPVAVYRVLRERDAPDRVAGGGRRTPLVGREQEVGVLVDRWEQSKEGHGQIVLLSGDAGIGKSRLVQELKAHVAGERHVRIEGRGSPYHQQSAFYPIVDLVEHPLRFERGDSSEAKLEKLTTALRDNGLPVDTMLPVFARLLGLAAPAVQDMVRSLTPQRQRQATLDAVLGLVVHLASRRPVLMIIEDLHWADPSTQEALELLLEQTLTLRVLMVLTARPEFRAAWGTRPHLTRLTLTRLRRSQAERLVIAVAAGKALPAEVLEQIAHKTDGVPLFVEELTKMVLESGWVREGPSGYELVGALPPLAIPTTLQDSLMARLDRLPTAKVIVQLGATLGRTFSYEVLEAIAELDPTTLKEGLDKLVEAELLYQRGLVPDATYSFKHALIQDAAYHTLLRSTRQHYHMQAAQALEARFPDTAAAQPEMLAHHYTQAGLVEQAVPHWYRAGTRAIERSANPEAIAHLTHGLALLRTLPKSPERIQRELDLLISLAPALMATKGYAAPEVEDTYNRARDLCRQVGETPRLLPVLLTLVTFFIFRANYRTAHELAAECLALVSRGQSLPRRRQAHMGLGNTLYHLGDFAAAQPHFEQVVTLVDAPERRSRPVPAVADPRVICLSHLGKILWLFGYPDQALQRKQEALTLAEELGQAHTRALASALTAWLHLLRGETVEAQEWAERSQALCREGEFQLWLAQSHIVRGWVLARQGREEGLEELREGVRGWQATGAALARPTHLALLAESLGRAGRPEEGLPLLNEALSVVEKTGERWGEAEIHRIKGELLASGPGDERGEAEACFHRALERARGQRARSLELRAATSLGRLWQRQGRHAPARALLAETYDAFTEGFDTPDLIDARALRQALS